MEDGQYYDLSGLYGLEDWIGKATRRNAADLFMLERVPVGVPGREIDYTVDLRHELNSQTGLPVFVPERSAVEFGPGSWPKDDFERHLFRRASIAALTASQGTTSSGFAS